MGFFHLRKIEKRRLLTFKQLVHEFQKFTAWSSINETCHIISRTCNHNLERLTQLIKNQDQSHTVLISVYAKDMERICLKILHATTC